jgi:hypothetical protein
MYGLKPVPFKLVSELRPVLVFELKPVPFKPTHYPD